MWYLDVVQYYEAFLRYASESASVALFLAALHWADGFRSSVMYIPRSFSFLLVGDLCMVVEVLNEWVGYHCREVGDLHKLVGYLWVVVTYL